MHVFIDWLGSSVFCETNKFEISFLRFTFSYVYMCVSHVWAKEGTRSLWNWSYRHLCALQLEWWETRWHNSRKINVFGDLYFLFFHLLANGYFNSNINLKIFKFRLLVIIYPMWKQYVILMIKYGVRTSIIKSHLLFTVASHIFFLWRITM